MEASWKPRNFMWDLWLTSRQGSTAIVRKQRERLSALVAYARTHSPFYRELYRGVPPETVPLEALPSVRKPDLMAHFDDWVTDPAVTWELAEAFVGDPSKIGQRFLGRYSATVTSGSIGVRGITLHDSEARQLYGALSQLRTLTPLHEILRISTAYSRRGYRSAIIASTGGHHGMESGRASRVLQNPTLADTVRIFSCSAPVSELVEQLNAFQPTQLMVYPSTGLVLARAQQAGHLRIRPIQIFSGAETLEPEGRIEIEQSFGCRVRDNYGANEMPFMAFDCRYGWLHLNTDWLVLEPVDRDHQPVPPGQASHSALLTNLANRIQPFIRYEMGDSVTVRADPCPCGSVFPAIRVVGRASEVLTLHKLDGTSVHLAWVVFGNSIRADKRISRYQVIQTAPARLRIRLDIEPGHESHQEDIWEGALRVVHELLTNHDLPHVEIERASEPPQINPTTGKYRRVWREYE